MPLVIVLLCVETHSHPELLALLVKIETSAIDYFTELVEGSDKNKDGRIDFGEFEDMGNNFIIRVHLHYAQTLRVYRIKKKIPMAENHLTQVSG